jgi:hypothetical protein
MAANFEQMFHVMGNKFAEDNPGECVAGEKLFPRIEVTPKGKYNPCRSDVIYVYDIALYCCLQETHTCAALYNEAGDRVGHVKIQELPNQFEYFSLIIVILVIFTCPVSIYTIHPCHP